MDPACPTDGIGEEALLHQALAGCEASFAELYRRRQGAIYRFAFHMCGDTQAAEDVTQAVFIVLLEQGRRFDATRGALISFLFGIARNLVLQRFRKQEVALPEHHMWPSGEDIGQDLERREMIEHVRAAVLSLPVRYRAAVVLCDLEGVSYEDAARILECPLGTVRSRLKRARGLLAQKLTAHAKWSGVVRSNK